MCVVCHVTQLAAAAADDDDFELCCPLDQSANLCTELDILCNIEYPINRMYTTGAALPENNEASTELTTANCGTFTSCSARLGSQSCYRSLDQ